MRSSDPESRIADQGRIGETARLDHALMLLADARLPTGAHAVSGGLEAALLVGGLTSADIADYLRTRLVSAVPVDAGVAVLARRAVAAGPSSSSSDDALGLADAWAARTPAPAVRDAARLAGRGAASTPAAPPTGRGRGHVAAAARRAGRRMAAARPRCPRRRPRARRPPHGARARLRRGRFHRLRGAQAPPARPADQRRLVTRCGRRHRRGRRGGGRNQRRRGPPGPGRTAARGVAAMPRHPRQETLPCLNRPLLSRAMSP